MSGFLRPLGNTWVNCLLFSLRVEDLGRVKVTHSSMTGQRRKRFGTVHGQKYCLFCFFRKRHLFVLCPGLDPLSHPRPYPLSFSSFRSPFLSPFSLFLLPFLTPSSLSLPRPRSPTFSPFFPSFSPFLLPSLTPPFPYRSSHLPSLPPLFLPSLLPFSPSLPSFCLRG